MFVKLKFTTDSQNVLQLNQGTNGHVWSWPVTPFPRSRSASGWSDRLQNRAGKVSLHFRLTLNTPWVLSVVTDKNLKVEVGRTWWLYLEKKC